MICMLFSMQTLSEKSKSLFENFAKLQENARKIQKMHAHLEIMMRKDNRRVKDLLPSQKPDEI
jgi:hypothetical protein